MPTREWDSGVGKEITRDREFFVRKEKLAGDVGGTTDGKNRTVGQGER
jgi:hypothetical protein